MHVFLNLMLIRSFPPPPSLFHHLERMMRERERERERGRERKGGREREGEKLKVVSRLWSLRGEKIKTQKKRLKEREGKGEEKIVHKG